MKILIGLTEISGYAQELAKGFNDIGIDCSFISLTKHPFEYGGEEISISLLDKYMKIYNLMKASNCIFGFVYYFILFLLRIRIFIWTIMRYDVYIFIFGESFFKLYDLPILKLLNKKIIFVFLGSDGRPVYIDGFVHLNVENEANIKYMCDVSMKQKKRIQRIEKHADHIIFSRTCAHFFSNAIIEHNLIGFPGEILNNSINMLKSQKDGVKILHSPSDMIAKGTKNIRSVISKLKKEGYNIEYVEITGMTHNNVLRELQTCDIVIDQVYSDVPMAGFATESAWFGKPVLVSGYYADKILEDYDEKYIPSTLFCCPDDIYYCVKLLIDDKEFSQEIGKKAYEFVKSNWDRKIVARKYLQIINDDIPKEWMFDPNYLNYVEGAGISLEDSKKRIRIMIEKYGIKSLQLSDKPELEKLFREFAYS